MPYIYIALYLFTGAIVANIAGRAVNPPFPKWVRLACIPAWPLLFVVWYSYGVARNILGVD